MMMRFLPPLLFAALASCAPGGDLPHSGNSGNANYAALQEREIKALSDAEVLRLQKGEGGGEALPAELNGLAGPKHVLELAEQLQLTPWQLRQTRELFARMQREASAYGEALVEEERKLDAFFANGGDDTSEMLNMLGTIGKFQALVRFSHLIAHLRQDALLTKEQRELYIELRGYRHHDRGH